MSGGEEDGMETDIDNDKGVPAMLHTAQHVPAKPMAEVVGRSNSE